MQERAVNGRSRMGKVVVVCEGVGAATLQAADCSGARLPASQPALILGRPASARIQRLELRANSGTIIAN